MLLPLSPNVKIQQSQREKMIDMSFLAFEFETVKSRILSCCEVTLLQNVFNRFAQKILQLSSIVVFLSDKVMSIKLGDHITKVVTKEGQSILIIHKIQEGLCVTVVLN